MKAITDVRKFKPTTMSLQMGPGSLGSVSLFGVSAVKNLLANAGDLQQTWVRSLGWEESDTT